MHRLKQTSTKIIKTTLRTFGFALTGRRAMIVLGVALFISGLGVAYEFRTRDIEYTFSGENCVKQWTLFPELHIQRGSDDYLMQYEDNFTIDSVPIVSRKACVKVRQIPDVGVQTVETLTAAGVKGLSYQISLPKLPEPDLSVFDTPLAVHEPLTIKLSQPDTKSAYRLETGGAYVDCITVESNVSCDVAVLKLAQGTQFDAVLTRRIGDNSAVLYQNSITTLTATVISQISIQSGQIVYERLPEISFTADKELVSAQVSMKRASGEPVTGKTNVTGKIITYTFDTDLVRNENFEITVDSVKANDGSSLAEPYLVTFSTSGGPKVVNVNIGTYGIDQNQHIIVTLDQSLAHNFVASSVASISGSNATISSDGNKIYFRLQAGKCTDIALRISGELTSIHGVSDVRDWSYASRTTCASISSIGSSVQGRSIMAYSFGSGSDVILYVGAMHGNEKSSGYILDRWIDELESRAREIPQGKRIVVIPRISPDAFLANTRRNARNVDLNRNFPTAAWKSDVTMPGGQLVTGGGGAEPLSEPETRALADYTLALQPRLVLTYHAVASVVIANESGVSAQAAVRYASESGYTNEPKSATGDIFEYDTTGAYEDWLYEAHGIGVLLVELGSMSNSQFDRNRNAMWSMMQL